MSRLGMRFFCIIFYYIQNCEYKKNIYFLKLYLDGLKNLRQNYKKVGYNFSRILIKKKKTFKKINKKIIIVTQICHYLRQIQPSTKGNICHYTLPT
jgi:hypothetical protein